MYNTERPKPEDMPSTKQLIRSTLISIVSAIVILITIVLPSEYGVDPTGVGKVLGLSEMGEIRMQLEEEAKEHQSFNQNVPEKPSFAGSLLNEIVAIFSISSAYAQAPSTEWSDEISFELTPGQGVEIKVVMQKDAQVEFNWTSSNGKANFDLHGDGKGKSTSYKKGRGVTGDNGILVAKFDGNHGWFWRNRDKQTITINLQVRGAYSEIKKDF